MTRIDFHTNIPDKIGYTCRLVRKARGADQKVVIFADPTQLAALDQALWTFSEQDFLPHVMAGDELAALTPVILTNDADTPLPHHQVLVNLAPQAPAHFARFERMVEIVSTSDDDVQAGRERYRQYQQRGYPLTHFVADPS